MWGKKEQPRMSPNINGLHLKGDILLCIIKYQFLNVSMNLLHSMPLQVVLVQNYN